MRSSPSPHFNARPTRPVKLIVLHADAGGSDTGTLAWLKDKVSRVSYHVLIGRDGTAYRVVPDAKRAWHAGKSAWPGVGDVNGESLGLAFANKHDGVEPLTAAQIATAKQVIADWQAAHGPLAVVTHAMVSPGRKTDPERIPNFRLADYA